jgi:hypothetical protein
MYYFFTHHSLFYWHLINFTERLFLHETYCLRYFYDIFIDGSFIIFTEHLLFYLAFIICPGHLSFLRYKSTGHNAA